MPDQALVDELENRAPRLLDRNLGVAVVDLQEIDALDPEPSQAPFDVVADRLGSEIHGVVAVLAPERPALREHEHVLATAERPPDDLLRAAPPVEGRGVDPVHPQVERGVERPHRVALVLRAPVHPPDPG